jgi:hypothetical protein
MDIPHDSISLYLSGIRDRRASTLAGRRRGVAAAESDLSRDPTDEEIQWVLRHVAKSGWAKGRKGINAHRQAVARNGALGGRP